MPLPPGEVYDRHAEEFDEATALENLPESFRDLLSSFVDAVPGPRVLDAGCGPGRDAEFFHERGLDPVGVDVAPGMIRRARATGPGKFLLMDLRHLAFEDDAFDGVWCPASVFFVDPDGQAAILAAFARVLRPGGVARVGFKLGDGRIEVEKWGETTVEYRPTRDEARSMLEAAGFEVTSSSVNEASADRTWANFACRVD